MYKTNCKDKKFGITFVVSMFVSKPTIKGQNFET